jgi:NAD-dependent SIR2 family protein deacetylase
MKLSTGDYWDKCYLDSLKKTRALLLSTENLLIGVGAGMTASGGLNYSDEALAQKWYPHYSAIGSKSIIEIMSLFWPNTINEKNDTLFWGFWANHIYHIRYEPDVLKPYVDLFAIAKDKEHFICSTNVDGQLEKAGFDKSRIFAPQGDYALFQCRKPCSQEVYQNKDCVMTMIENMVSPFEIRNADIPRCPKCGDYLMPNLRCDGAFVETPHLVNAEPYSNFIQNSQNKKLVLLELGVGFNTPVIIRYPFETITLQYPNATLVRVNTADVSVSDKIKEKAICIQDDLGKVLSDVLKA